MVPNIAYTLAGDNKKIFLTLCAQISDPLMTFVFFFLHYIVYSDAISFSTWGD